MLKSARARNARRERELECVELGEHAARWISPSALLFETRAQNGGCGETLA